MPRPGTSSWSSSATGSDGDGRGGAQREAGGWDGTRILFYETDAEGEDHVWVLDVDGEARRLLAPGIWPTWSPDGSRVLFTGEGGLSVVPADGSAGPRLLVPGALYGALAPDGSRLAYITRGETHVTVYLAAPDGTRSHPVLTRPRPIWE